MAHALKGGVSLGDGGGRLVRRPLHLHPHLSCLQTAL